MPNTREKQIEMHKILCASLHCNYDELQDAMTIDTLITAENLIANGVTVQKEAKLYWKPVKPGEWNLTCSACDSHLGCREDANHCPQCGAKFLYPKAVVPQPPKGSARRYD